MDQSELQRMIAGGEDSRHEFKAEVRNSDSLASEMAALANSEGGAIYVGVGDDGALRGLSATDVRRMNQLISNAASQHVRSPLTVQTENVILADGNVVIVLRVPRGIDKPYFDRNGAIWLRSGADKRRVNSKEELRRLFQDVDLLHADEVPTRAGADALDHIRFRDFIKDEYGLSMPTAAAELGRLLVNMNLATGENLNLAGLLLFGERPQLHKPTCMVKAVSYPGTTISVDRYQDSEDFEGPLTAQFAGVLAFVMRNLRKIQRGQDVNTLGKPEVPRVVFEELLVNALVHRDYFISASVRVFVFADRVEIINPGHLPNSLTVEKIKAGNSNIRNPVLASFVAKGLLPYRGLGTGIPRALADWPGIAFVEDRDACTFTATVQRAINQGDHSDALDGTMAVHEADQHVPGAVLEATTTEPNATITATTKETRATITATIDVGLSRSQQDVLRYVSAHQNATYEEIAAVLGKHRATVARAIQRLRDAGFLRRVGSRKNGHWEVDGESTNGTSAPG